jgi:hypothetical protein
MNKQQLAEELSDFTFEIARLADECDISKGDLAILELCHRELDRISEDLMEEERENHALEQQHQDDLIAYRSAVAL